jgi:8-oxo-dGTP pyrophosphatase MutT (NUDIX family)
MTSDNPEAQSTSPNSPVQSAAGQSVKPWKMVSSKALGDYRIFSLNTVSKLSPRTGREHDFFVIKTSDGVNVIAVTPDQKLVMVEQVRHGTDTVELEVPGGMIDAKDASPVEAGLRELREETGYAGENARSIGSVFPNPAIMNNTCHTVLVENCRCGHAREWDHAEDIVTRLVPVEDIPRMVAEGVIRHSLVVVALTHFDLLRRGVKRS